MFFLSIKCIYILFLLNFLRDFFILYKMSNLTIKKVFFQIILDKLFSMHLSSSLKQQKMIQPIMLFTIQNNTHFKQNPLTKKSNTKNNKKVNLVFFMDFVINLTMVFIALLS